VLRLRVEQLTFAYRDAPPILRDVNLELATGETVAIVGRNGCGKTTLLRLIAGLLRPAAGHVRVDSDSGADVRGQVGVILQNPDHQMIADTVDNELALGLELRGRPPTEIQSRVDDALCAFGLREFRRRAPQMLSGGQKQRLALAAIMISSPAFLLLDEPDSFLDAPSRAAFRSALNDLRATTGLLWALPRVRDDIAVDRWYLLADQTLHDRDSRQIREWLGESQRTDPHV
jgi:energy-coupling factor transporter ATP-binding protein EcfA2